MPVIILCFDHQLKLTVLGRDHPRFGLLAVDQVGGRSVLTPNPPVIVIQEATRRLRLPLRFDSTYRSSYLPTMLCAWAEVDESTRDQYASYVTQTAARLSARAWHFEAEENPTLEFENPSRHNLFTIYDVPKPTAHKSSKEQSDPLSELAHGAPKQARIDKRVYEEIESFQAEDYIGDFADLDFLVVITLDFKDKQAFETYYDWTRKELKPQMLNTPEFLRARYYRATQESLAEDGTQGQQEANRIKSLSIYELDSDDWLWQRFVEVCQSDDWRRMEETMDLEMRKWCLKRCYPDDGKVRDRKEEANDDE
ncbi:hypothetical protein K458DRAFT_393399 [Lentithecium fluviatile CBS 122367]|uniref:Uncharacterized protein n=1 Tax=Lentithecium fluviatile CBS 122367 TaxID=1168545 RepID=A0A6G1IPC4_9PLEO|nr:hypothetical protein K458DRAFT_393399 [Lentithecium fluviatile CBS 122367]